MNVYKADDDNLEELRQRLEKEANSRHRVMVWYPPLEHTQIETNTPEEE